MRAARRVTRRACGAAILRKQPPTLRSSGGTESQRTRTTSNIKEKHSHGRKIDLIEFWGKGKVAILRVMALTLLSDCAFFPICLKMLTYVDLIHYYQGIRDPV